MPHLLSLKHSGLVLAAVLVLGAPALGCTATVVSGSTSNPEETGGGGGGTGGNGAGGDAACTEYDGPCTPGQTLSCGGGFGSGSGTGGGTGGGGPPVFPEGSQGCLVEPGTCMSYWDPTGCDTPLVLSFDGAPVEYLTDRDHAFDLNGTRSQLTDWPTARTPWLATDRDGNGSIDDGSELFGSMTVTSGGRRAPNGFAALRELDADGDGRITPADPGFSHLLVWADRDGDRRSTAGELASASSWELLSIDLDYRADAPRCDARGNCEVERAAFHYRDAAGVIRTGAVVDVHFATQR
jgi:hypothetical protein